MLHHPRASKDLQVATSASWAQRLRATLQRQEGDEEDHRGTEARHSRYQRQTSSSSSESSFQTPEEPFQDERPAQAKRSPTHPQAPRYRQLPQVHPGLATAGGDRRRQARGESNDREEVVQQQG